jgi:hypothetical protein
MSDKKYAIISHQGGLGKSIAATAVAQAFKNNHKDRELIVVTPWPELWVNLPFVYRVFQLGNTSYFYEEFVSSNLKYLKSCLTAAFEQQHERQDEFL